MSPGSSTGRVGGPGGAIARLSVASVLLLSMAGLLGCSSGSGSEASSTTSSQNSAGNESTASSSAASSSTASSAPTKSSSVDLVESVCDKRVEVETMGKVSAPEIAEASGLAASRTSPGIWWTHNDSGGKPELYALNESGDLVAVLKVSGAKAVDWEDLAIATDADGSESIYVGDIGDNSRRRDHITIYRVTAPEVSTDKPSAGPEQLRATAEKFDLVYPDGARDAEALFVDATEDHLYIIDKDWSLKGRSNLYRTSINGAANGSGSKGSGSKGSGSTATLEKVAELEFPPATLVTAADLSPDGNAVAVRAYGVEFLYQRDSGRSIPDALTSDSCTGPKIPELQGEAIAFSSDGTSYATIPEGTNPQLHRVVIKD